MIEYLVFKDYEEMIEEIVDESYDEDGMAMICGYETAQRILEETNYSIGEERRFVSINIDNYIDKYFIKINEDDYIVEPLTEMLWGALMSYEEVIVEEDIVDEVLDMISYIGEDRITIFGYECEEDCEEEYNEKCLMCDSFYECHGIDEEVLEIVDIIEDAIDEIVEYGTNKELIAEVLIDLLENFAELIID